MRVRDLTITAGELDALRRACDVGSTHEGATQFLCGSSHLDDDPWGETADLGPELRLTVHRHDPLPPERVRASETSVSWDMDCYVRLLWKVRKEGLHPGICHSHPAPAGPFSSQDDENEAHLRDLLQRRNRDDSQVLVSVLFRGETEVNARVWGPVGPPKTVGVRALGQELVEVSREHSSWRQQVSPGFLQRQALAVGVETVKLLQELRIGVVGCGGTGSAVAELLARAGVGRILLIDPDIVDETNLNRLYGSRRQDAQENRPKVQVLREHLERMDLGTKVAIRKAPLAEASLAKVLRTCDIIFGCTDGHLGRLILNRLAYFYLLPVIDTGLAVAPSSPGRPAQVSGRVTVLRPGTACLLCRSVVSPRRAREEGLRFKHPEEYDRQVKEGYITESDTPTPVVGTFTTETATAAVNELLAAVAALRGRKGWSSERTIRYDLDRCRPTGCPPVDGCAVCGGPENWGVGDMEPFLDLGGF